MPSRNHFPVQFSNKTYRVIWGNVLFQKTSLVLVCLVLFGGLFSLGGVSVFVLHVKKTLNIKLNRHAMKLFWEAFMELYHFYMAGRTKGNLQIVHLLSRKPVEKLLRQIYLSLWCASPFLRRNESNHTHQIYTRWRIWCNWVAVSLWLLVTCQWQFSGTGVPKVSSMQPLSFSCFLLLPCPERKPYSRAHSLWSCQQLH